VSSVIRVALAVPTKLGALLVALGTEVGGMTLLCAGVARRLWPPRFDRPELLRNLHRMGVESVAVVAATAVFVGGIMVIQAGQMVQRFGVKELVGWGAGFATLREIGPLLIALVFNGRVGANNTAELASMTVTDQIDGLRALAIDPIAYLVIPRLLAMVAMITTLTVIGDGVAIAGAVGAANLLLDVDPRTFLTSFVALLRPWDFLSGLVKAAVFGMIIALVSCHHGLSVRGGAPGVGRAVTSSVVASATGIFAIDYLFTFLLP
jgi:phospholipid/cholesterol/gamma-HCH transport system permease protein